MKSATFFKRFKALTYWIGRNVQETLHCESTAQAKGIIKKSGIEQNLIISNS